MNRVAVAVAVQREKKREERESRASVPGRTFGSARKHSEVKGREQGKRGEGRRGSRGAYYVQQEQVEVEAGERGGVAMIYTLQRPLSLGGEVL